MGCAWCLGHGANQACAKCRGEPNFSPSPDARTASPGYSVGYHVTGDPVPANPDFRPDHDSLFVRFDQLEFLLKRMGETAKGLERARTEQALDLLGMIRGQVLR